MLADWIVTFEFARQSRRVETPFESQWDFEELRNGFWVNEQYELVREPRGKYWIPPGRIMHIEKKA